MASVKLTWAGLEELRAELRRMPEEFAGEAGHIIEGIGNAAVMDIKGGYPRRTGKMRDAVTVEHRQDRFGAVSTVRNADPQALSFEVGTQARHTKIGANRGAMPPGNVFYPRIRKWRRKMYDRLKEMLVRKGLSVSGDP